MISPLATTPERVHPQGTVLLAMIGEGKTRGQAAILDVAAAHNQNSAAIRLDPAVARPEWLYYVLMQRYAETRRAGSGNNQPALNKARVQSIEIPLPTLVDQDRIVSSIELSLTVLARLATTVGLALTRSECLRRSILESAFEGCLVPQVSVTESAMMRLAETRSDVRTLADAQRKKRQ